MWQQKQKATVGRRTLKAKGEVRMEMAECSRKWKAGGRMRQKQKVAEGRKRQKAALGGKKHKGRGTLQEARNRSRQKADDGKRLAV